MPKILVVDDDRAVQTMLVDLLEERGYEVDTARNGRQALERLRAGDIDLLLLDVLIPHINGFALLEQLRAEDNLTELPVIMMSGIYRSRNHRSEMAQRFGVIEYLDKPLQPTQLLDLVEEAVGAGKRKRRATERDEDPAEEPPHIERSSAEPLSPREERLVEPDAREEKAEVEAAAREEFKQSAFVLQGSIKKMPVAPVLGKLWRQKETGALLLRNDKVKKIVYMDAGEVVAVKSNLVSECLGRLLVRERLITADQCTESIKRMKSSGKRQGQVLVEMNVVTERNLEFGLEMQLETKLFEVFLWDSGEYRFQLVDRTRKSADGAQIEWRGGSLIVEGIRRAFDETRLRALMVPILDVPLTFREETIDLRSMRFTKLEIDSLAQMKDGRTTRELLGIMQLDPPDALRVIYSLIALDLVIPRT